MGCTEILLSANGVKEYISMKGNTTLELAEPIKFIGRINDDGRKESYQCICPQRIHHQVIKGFKGKHVKVTIEDAILRFHLPITDRNIVTLKLLNYHW